MGPENDFSMKTWMNALDYTMDNTPVDISRKLSELQDFYSNKDYYPFEVSYQHNNGTEVRTRLQALPPRRAKNEIKIEADSGSVSAIFNFGIQNRADAICNMVLMITMIILMVGFSLL